MNTLEYNRIKCIPVVQNQQEFLVSVFKIDQILRFTKYTTRLMIGFDEENKPLYNKQIQRDVENSRVQKIADFLINDPEATFPTNIVLHIPQEVIEKQEKESFYLEITLKEIVFDEIRKKSEDSDVFVSIIDGQHRTRGIEIAIERLITHITSIAKTLETSGKRNEELEKRRDYYVQRLKDLKNIQLVVSFFIDKSIEYQAMIFSTINRTQKRVSESLVSSLFGLDTKDTPQKTALQVVLELNSNDASPFYNRIKLYGGDYEKNQSPPLTQAGMVNSIVNLICENSRESENDRYRKRKELNKRIANLNKSLPFRYYYANDLDTRISDIFYYYFTAVERTFVKADGVSYWRFDPDTMSPTNILQTTVGYQALLQILTDILIELKEDDRFSVDSYENYLMRANSINLDDIKRYHFTSKSKSIFYLDLNLCLWPSENADDPRIIRLNEILKED